MGGEGGVEGRGGADGGEGSAGGSFTGGGDAGRTQNAADAPNLSLRDGRAQV